MKCRACDEILTNFESVIKYDNSNEFLDLCGKCRSFVVGDISTTERYELFDPDVDLVDYAALEEDEPRPVSSTSDDDGEV